MASEFTHQNKRRMKPVLWLCSWYPSRVHATNGDFVERHARAMSKLMPLVVLLIEKDEKLHSWRTKVERTEEFNLIVYRVYYGKSISIGLLEKAISFWRFRILQKRFYRKLEEEHGVPALVHVHVAYKAGLLAMFLKKKSRLPYLLTEHWTGYAAESHPNIDTVGIGIRSVITKIIQQAEIVLPVSEHLGKAMARLAGPIKYRVVPNAVDTNYFFYRPFQHGIFRFIHASYLNYQKNPQAIIEAASLLAGDGYKFELIFVGNASQELKDLAKAKDATGNYIFFKGEVEYTEVAHCMQQAHALVMFSRFENLPCVVLEALCCGLPVISSRVGGMEEVINSSNGILVPPNDVQELTASMKTMIDKYPQFDREAIAKDACAKFNYSAVAQKYLSCYKEINPAIRADDPVS
jgi:glycosyltransferase involved in cell wall biosynthesis